jgi:tRNA(Ile)-lysidine synthase
MRSLVIQKAITELCGVSGSLTSDHLVSVERLLEAATGETAGSLPGGIRVKRHGDEIELTTTEDVALEDWELEPAVPGVVQIPGTDIRVRFEVVERSPQESMPKTMPHEAYLDFGSISGRLALRNRRPGDRFHPLGAPGSRKLKDFFIDTKFPKGRRDRIPLLVDEEGIICVLGYIIGDRVKVTKESRRLLHIVMSGTVPSV